MKSVKDLAEEQRAQARFDRACLFDMLPLASLLLVAPAATILLLAV